MQQQKKLLPAIREYPKHTMALIILLYIYSTSIFILDTFPMLSRQLRWWRSIKEYDIDK